ncbi:transcriptional coactivator p15/PC4 family protein [Bradyrhizobium manausense]|uniref:transcriptional coactivator p15/PC4 family protein n=1 Tax=Bradyrhizobium manausense TaxID=989370 RepID=UPI001BAB8A8A|nr:transcriptional coactivator p15/PC4 family protein [Bradyrhizobium manausense]MBR1086464.1 transcriptional coactivator p15/PC4 family protein [Bradyrhizobium manausense]
MTETARFNSRRSRQQRYREDALAGRLDVASDPAFATSPGDPLAEPRVVFQMWRGRQRTECIRLTISRLNGKAIGDLRIFFVTPTGHMQASKKGVAFSIEKLPDIRKALEKAEVIAIELDLIEAAP